ncbi:NrdR family transcriptional regulator [Candidatus Sneabacter namystus]|uniref:Transcriptional repressor NrdR n=1 Tax=Candidatus Sneabacter namystus TaxID=2601646 RepID=A0A5C0UJ06_9RICK|nr:ATP cone domain-containing protein [Candidatus Sneabacter namystus]QEK39493.1 transcriptional repressor NrdR [Candidatus Sneabacter namystus]
MLCPFCEGFDTGVKDSRCLKYSVKRRRWCGKCNKKFTTLERVVSECVYVIKSSGIKEPFNRSILRDSVLNVFKDGSVSQPYIDRIIDSFVDFVSLFSWQEISTQQIVSGMLKILVSHDVLASIRFAALYKSFDNVSDFLSFVQSLAAGHADNL